MFEKVLRRAGFVPVAELDEALSEASRARIAAREMSHLAASQEAEIERMAARFAGTVDGQAWVLDLVSARAEALLS